MVSAALNICKSETINILRIDRVVDKQGDLIQGYAPAVEITNAKVLPASPEDLKAVPDAATYNEVFSVYLFNSVSFIANDKIAYNGKEYEVFRGGIEI